jgi:hypothetical protein
VWFRICWESKTDSRHGDWEWWEEPGDPAEVLAEPANGGAVNLPRGLEDAIEMSGFGWSVETSDERPT